MIIQYQFNVDKAVAAIATFVTRLGPMDKLKLVKLLYFADRDCFVRYGHPITGDRQVAMKHGPVPSGCLDVLNGEIDSPVFSYIHVRDRQITPDERPPGLPFLDEDEKDSLDRIIREYGNWTTSRLYEFVHKLPEYRESYEPRTSTTISYEKLLQYYGGAGQLENGRPVITRAMRRHLACPFPQSEIMP